jgi:hypothetical protein
VVPAVLDPADLLDEYNTMGGPVYFYKEAMARSCRLKPKSTDDGAWQGFVNGLYGPVSSATSRSITLLMRSPLKWVE